MLVQASRLKERKKQIDPLDEFCFDLQQNQGCERNQLQDSLASLQEHSDNHTEKDAKGDDISPGFSRICAYIYKVVDGTQPDR